MMGDKIHHGGVADILRHALDHVVQKAAVERAAAGGQGARQFVAAGDQALKERGDGVERPSMSPTVRLAFHCSSSVMKPSILIVHDSGDGGVHIGKVVVEQ